MRWWLLLGLMACGQGNADAPESCPLRCERMKDQLQRDFGIQNPSCWDSQMLRATTKSQCARLFESRWGVF